MRGLWLVVLVMGCGAKDDDAPIESDSDIIVLDSDTGPTDTDTDTTPTVPCGALLGTATFGGPQGEGDPIIAVADDGTTYVASYFQGAVTFDSGGPNEVTLNALGTLDTAVIRYSASGAFEWVRQIGGASTSSPRGLTALDNGVAIAGAFATNTTVSAGQADSQILVTQGTNDAFVASFDGTGALNWAKGFGGVANDFTEGIAALDDGSIIVVTTHDSTTTLGIGEANQVILPLPASATAHVTFVSLAGGNGNLQWEEHVTGDLTSKVDDVAADGDQLVVVGHVEGPGTAIFGASQPLAINMLPIGDLGFVARYASDGTILAVSEIQNWGADTVSMADDGSAVVSGAFNSSIVFAPGLAGEKTMQSAATDIFVARYQATGVFLWAVQSETVPGGLTSPFDIAADATGGSVVVGSLSSRARFGAGAPNETDLSAQGLWDGFAARYDSNGNLECARQIGGDMMDASYAVVRRPDGSWDVGGFYSLTATVSLGQADSEDLDAEGGTDIFRVNYAF